MASILNKLQSIPPVIFLNSSPYITLWQWQSIPRVWLLNCLQSIAKMISIKTTIYYMFYLPANLLSSLLSWARSWFPSANYILLTSSHSVFVATCLWLLSIFSLLWLSQSLLTEKSPFLQILMCWYPKIFSFYFLRLLTNVVEFKEFQSILSTPPPSHQLLRPHRLLSPVRLCLSLDL